MRAVELKLRKLAPSEREVALARNDADGYVLVRPIFDGLAGYEKSEPSMRNYYPDLIRAIDVKTEVARDSALRFAPADAEERQEKLAGEDVTPKHLAPADLPDDQDVIAQLTAGERFIADRNPRGAEAAFKSVLAKYPDQDRAWYGLGLVALLDHDGEPNTRRRWPCKAPQPKHTKRHRKSWATWIFGNPRNAPREEWK